MKNVLMTLFLVACGGVEVSEQAPVAPADSDAAAVVTPATTVAPVTAPTSTPVTDVSMGVSDVTPVVTAGGSAPVVDGSTGTTVVPPTGTTTGTTAVTTPVTH